MALAAMLGNPREKVRPAIPADASSNPPCTSLTSSRIRSSAGANHLPTMSEE